ncbi:hypothetical protein [Thiocystis violacea]|uniref:hypothetical protein n=1 Tax=Thiocystis violacea TaxID=13725 RepID=UPI0019052D28|nr:hypothetical protein [Thiocystis violacea]MBK1718420.1 hypothetical protein [Thiocystis violacea]
MRHAGQPISAGTQGRTPSARMRPARPGGHRSRPGTGTPRIPEPPAISKIPSLAWLHWTVFAISLLICAYCLFRPSALTVPFAYSDKLAHLAGFFTLVLFAGLATGRRGIGFAILMATLLALAIGSEWIQGTRFLPLRQGDAWDLTANLVGAWLGLITLRVTTTRQAAQPAPTPTIG